MHPQKNAFWFIVITVFLDTIGFGLLIPVGPRLIMYLTGWTEQQAAPYVGLLMATYAVLQFICSPVLGALSDRFGRRPVLLVALLGSGIDYIAMALSPTLWLFFLTRALNGMSGSTITVAFAYVADCTAPQKRGAAYGMLGAAIGVGFAIGPLAGGLLGVKNIHAPFYAAAAVTLLNAIYGYFVLPESLLPENRANITVRSGNPVAVFKGLGKYPFVAEIAFAFLFVNLAQYGLHSTWVLYTGSRYGWGMKEVAYSLGLVGVAAIIIQGGLSGRVIGLIGERKALIFSLSMAVLAFIGYGAATEGWMVYAVLGIASLGGIGQPAAQSLIASAVRADEQGRTQGVMTAMQNVANIIGPLIATSLFAYFNSDRAPVRIPGASFYAGAFFCLVGLGLAAFALARHKDISVPHPGVRSPGGPSVTPGDATTSEGTAS